MGEMGQIAVRVFKQRFSEQTYNRLDDFYFCSDSSDDNEEKDEQAETADDVNGIATELEPVEVVPDDWEDMASDSDWTDNGMMQCNPKLWSNQTAYSNIVWTFNIRFRASDEHFIDISGTTSELEILYAGKLTKDMIKDCGSDECQLFVFLYFRCQTSQTQTMYMHSRLIAGGNALM